MFSLSVTYLQSFILIPWKVWKGLITPCMSSGYSQRQLMKETVRRVDYKTCISKNIKSGITMGNNSMGYAFYYEIGKQVYKWLRKKLQLNDSRMESQSNRIRKTEWAENRVPLLNLFAGVFKIKTSLKKALCLSSLFIWIMKWIFITPNTSTTTVFESTLSANALIGQRELGIHYSVVTYICNDP